MKLELKYAGTAKLETISLLIRQRRNGKCRLQNANYGDSLLKVITGHWTIKNVKNTSSACRWLHCSK